MDVSVVDFFQFHSEIQDDIIAQINNVIQSGGQDESLEKALPVERFKKVITNEYLKFLT